MHEIRFSAGALPRTPLGSSRRSPSLPNRLGRGKPPPLSPPPRCLRHLGLVAPANWGGVSILQGGMEGPALHAQTFFDRLSAVVLNLATCMYVTSLNVALVVFIFITQSGQWYSPRET